MIFATVLSWVGVLLILLFVNPYEAGALGLLFFFTSFFLGLLGILSIVGFLVRYIFYRHEFVYGQVKRAFRQGLLLALSLTIVLFLQAERLLVWWNLLLLVALIGGIEYLFLRGEIKKDEVEEINNFRF